MGPRARCRFQKFSLWSWLLGSVTTIAAEATVLLDGSSDITREADEGDEAWQARRAAFRDTLQKRVIVLAHAITQVRYCTDSLQNAVVCAGLSAVRGGGALRSCGPYPNGRLPVAHAYKASANELVLRRRCWRRGSCSCGPSSHARRRRSG